MEGSNSQFKNYTEKLQKSSKCGADSDRHTDQWSEMDTPLI